MLELTVKESIKKKHEYKNTSINVNMFRQPVYMTASLPAMYDITARIV